MAHYKNIITPSGIEKVEIIGEELTKLEADITSWNNASADRKLAEIKQMRTEKLKETDFYALSDVTMSSEMSTYRQKMRDLPQDYTTENEYDLLLARDEQGNLTHSVWEKP